MVCPSHCACKHVCVCACICVCVCVCVWCGAVREVVLYASAMGLSRDIHVHLLPSSFFFYPHVLLSDVPMALELHSDDDVDKANLIRILLGTPSFPVGVLLY